MLKKIGRWIVERLLRRRTPKILLNPNIGPDGFPLGSEIVAELSGDECDAIARTHPRARK